MKGVKAVIACILVAMGSTALLMGALWQLEILWIDNENEWPYVLPFEGHESYDFEVWRDFWYVMIALAYAAPWILVLWLVRKAQKK